jgi:hypothetical protein
MKTKSDAQVWAMIIAGAGLAFLGVIETASAVYAFNTGDRSILILGLPLDALLKTAASLLAAIVAFGGAIVASAKRGKGKTLAYAVTFLCFAWTAANFSGFTAWARQSSEAASYRETVEYKDATATLAALHGSSDLNSTQYASKQDALEVTKRGEAPVTAERNFGDLVRAFAAIALVWGMASAFRLPAPAEKSQRRSAASQTAKGGWEGEKGEQRRAAIKARSEGRKLHAVK